MLPPSSRSTSAAPLLLLLLAAALTAPVVAAPVSAVEPTEAVLAGMEARLEKVMVARLEKAITAKLENRMGADQVEQQMKIASLETQLARQVRRVDILAAKNDKQQVQLERNSTEHPPAARVESVAAELGELRTRQERRFESAAAGHAAQQVQLDSLLERDDERRRLHASTLTA